MACPNTNSPQWKALVVKIGTFEAMREFIKNGEEIPDANKYEETFKGVNATMKIVGALQKTPRTSYPSNQVQGFYNDLIKQGAPKNQIELLKDHIARNNIKEINTNQLIVSLLGEMGYTVEINTAKQGKSGSFPDENEPAVDDSYFHEPSPGENTQYYSNLTVPGGTNYTENEIRTPAITPSIKGHAAFATTNGIGWFRSDEQVDKELNILANTNSFNVKFPDGSQYKVEKIGNNWHYNGEIITEEVAKDLFRGSSEAGKNFGQKSLPTKTRRILEVQSDLFQKGREKTDLIGKDNFFLGTSSNPDLHVVYEGDSSEGFAEPHSTYKTKAEAEEALKTLNNSNAEKNRAPNNFLQLLNKDNNWVNLFVKSIIQDSARRGYEKVLFPSGDTAAKVEGHQTVEDFILDKEDRLKGLRSLKYIVTGKVGGESLGAFDSVEAAEKQAKMTNDFFENEEAIVVPAEAFYSREIEQLEKEIADAKSGKLKISAVANFYENNIANILKKQGYSPTTITDEYGNKWNQVNLKEEHKDTIFFQKEGELGQSKASPKTISRMKQWLTKAGISVDQIRTESEKMAYGDVNGVAILLENVIKIAEGKESEALVEESMHFLTAMIKQGNRELYNKMMNRIGSSDMYQKVKQLYAEDRRYTDENGNLDVIKLKEEAVGKVLAEYYINGNDQENDTFLARVKSWWDSIVQWIKSLVNQNGDPFAEAIKEMGTVDPQVVDSERVKDIAGEIKDAATGMWKPIIEGMYENGEYSGIIKEIGSQLADEASFEGTRNILGKNDALIDKILAIRGEYTQLQEEPNPFKKFEDKEKEYNLTKHEETNDPDDENNSSYYTITVDGKQVRTDRVTDYAKRKNAQKGGRNFFADPNDERQKMWQKIAMEGVNGHSDLENIIDQSTNDDGTLKPKSEIKLDLKIATNSGIYKKFVQYLLGDEKNVGFLYTFPEGTKFKTEIKVLDPNSKTTVIDEKTGEPKVLTGRAGTIDLLAILPDGKARIYDWKFMGFLLNKPDQDFLKRSQHGLQLGEYKRIASLYGIKNIQAFTIPIHAEFKYNTDKDTGDTIPYLNNVVMGSVNMRDEERTPLLSVVPEGQSTGNDLVDQLVKRLTVKYNRIYSKKVGQEEKSFKRDVLNELSSAIRNLQVAINFDPLAAEAENFVNSIDKLLDKYSKTDFTGMPQEQINSSIEELQDALTTADYYSSIDRAFVKEYGSSNLSDKRKATLESLRRTSAISTEKAADLLKYMFKLVDSIATSEEIPNYLTPQKEAVNLLNSFTDSAAVPNKSLQLATRIMTRARSRDAIETARESDKFKTIYLAATKEAGGKNLFDVIAHTTVNPSTQKREHQLIPIVDPDFYTQMRRARNKKDAKFIKDNINYEKYKELLTKSLQAKFDAIDAQIYSTDEKSNKRRREEEKARARKQLDFTRSDFFGWQDRDFIYLIRKTQKDGEHISKQYSSLPPAAKALHEYFVGLNEKAKEIGYLKRDANKLFIPFITATMLQRLNQNGGKMSALKNSITDQFLVQDIDRMPYGKINEATGELERNVPVYFTSNSKNLEDYSKDFLLFTPRYIQALQEYQTSVALEDTFLALHKVEQNKGHLQTERGRVIFEGETPKIFEGNERNAALLQKYIDDELYGISEESDTLVDKLLDSTIKSGTEEQKNNKKISVKKTIQFGNLMTQQLAVGFKALVAIPNYAGAHLQSIINAGNYSNASEYMAVHGRVVTSTLSNIEKGCIHFLIPLNENVSLEKRREIARKESLAKWLGTWTFNDAMMSTNRIPDKAHELTNALVWLKNTILDEKGNMVNIKQYYRKQYEWRYDREVSEEQRNAAEKEMEQKIKEAKEKLVITKIAKFNEAGEFVIPGLNNDTLTLGAYRAKIIEYGRYITGQMSRENKADYRRNIIGRSFMMFKNWIPKQVQVRALDIHRNPILDEWEYGRTRLFFKTWAHLGWQNILKIRHLTSATPEGIEIMREMLEQKKSDYYKKTGEQLTITEPEFFDMMRKELRSEYKELALLVGILGMLVAAKLAVPPDDEEDPFVRNRYKQFLRAVNKVSDELYFYWSPTSAEAITRGTVLPSLGILSKVIQLGEHASTEIFAVDWKTGEFFSPDVRERNQTLKYFLNLTPIASQFSSEILPLVDPELAKDLGYKLTTLSRPQQ